MITANGQVLFYNTPLILGGVIRKKCQVTMIVKGKAYICQLTSLNGENIEKGEKVSVNVDILYGEIGIEDFLTSPQFILVSSKQIGEGRILQIKSIMFESDIKEIIDEKRYAEIVNVAIEKGIIIKK